MRRILFILPFVFCVILVSCNNSTENQNEDEKTNSKEDETVNSNIDIYDYYYINRAPEATEKQDLNELIKLSLTTTSPIPTGIAIDIGNNEIYKNPRHTINGVKTYEETVKFDEKERLLKILEKHNVQDWKEDYTTEDPDSYQDGAGWNLILQFEDGTVEKHRGQGSTVDIFPEEFVGFVEEIDQLVKEILGEDYRKDFNNEP